MTLYVCFLYRSHDLLANIHELESLVFQKSVRDLINKENGFLVVDDELISSRAKDVEVKIALKEISGHVFVGVNQKGFNIITINRMAYTLLVTLQSNFSMEE